MKKTRKNSLGLIEFQYLIEILKESDLFNKGEKYKVFALTADHAFEKFCNKHIGDNKYLTRLYINFYGENTKENEKIIKLTKDEEKMGYKTYIFFDRQKSKFYETENKDNEEGYWKAEDEIAEEIFNEECPAGVDNSRKDFLQDIKNDLILVEYLIKNLLEMRLEEDDFKWLKKVEAEMKEKKESFNIWDYEYELINLYKEN